MGAVGALAALILLVLLAVVVWHFWGDLMGIAHSFGLTSPAPKITAGAYL